MPILPEVEEAKKAYEKKDYRQAARLFSDAANRLEADGDILMAAEIKNNCSVSWLQAGEPQSALDAALGTDQIFANAKDLRRQAISLANQAAALDDLGSLTDALNMYQIAADLLKTIHEDDMRAYVLKNISTLQLRSGDKLQSLATMNAALENKKKLGFKEKLLKKLLRIPFKMMR